MRVSAFCAFLTLTWSLSAGRSSFDLYRPAPLHVDSDSGAGFLLYIKPRKPTKYTSCAVEYQKDSDQKATRYELLYGQNKTVITENGETLAHFQFENPSACGVRVLKAAAASSGTWKLKATSANGEVEYEQKDVQVLTKRHDCPSLDRPFGFRHCTRIDLDTGKEYSCYLAPRINNFRCEFHSEGKMTSDEEVLENQLERYSPLVVDSGSTIFNCSTSNRLRIGTCYVEHLPSGKVYNVEEHLLHDRYSAFKSDFYNGICQFEIRGPAQEADVGIWRMYMKERSPYDDKVKTCLFQVKGEGDHYELKKRLEEELRAELVVKTIKEEVTIECAKNVFYPIHLCYLVADGLVFATDAQLMAEGSCRFTVKPGKHICGFNGPSESDLDFVRNVEVIRFESEISKGRKTVSGGNVALECHHNLDAPIRSCLFQSPTKKVFRLASDSFESKEFSYFGGKFATGHCGILLTSSVAAESGQWRCIFRDRQDVAFTTDILV